MTDIKTHHPKQIPSVTLVEEGRKISFAKACLGDVEILRKVNDRDWKTISKAARSPFIDDDPLPEGSNVSYLVRLEQNDGKKEFELHVYQQ